MTKISIKMLLSRSDSTAIRLGGAFRMPPASPVAPVTAKTDTTDLGRIRLGGAFRLAA